MFSHYLFDTMKNSISLWPVQENGVSKRIKKTNKQKTPNKTVCFFSQLEVGSL